MRFAATPDGQAALIAADLVVFTVVILVLVVSWAVIGVPRTPREVIGCVITHLLLAAVVVLSLGWLR